MDDLIEYLKDEGYFTENNQLNMDVRKWCMDLPVNDILPLNEIWRLIIQHGLITIIRRNNVDYKLKDDTCASDNFLYENGAFNIKLRIGRDPSGNVDDITGYFCDSNIKCFYYKFWC